MYKYFEIPMKTLIFLDLYSKFPYNPYKPYKTTDRPTDRPTEPRCRSQPSCNGYLRRRTATAGGVGLHCSDGGQRGLDQLGTS